MGQEEINGNTKNEAQEDMPKSNRDFVRIKMEEMQKRIDELKEKVRNEGEMLHNEDSFKSNILDDQIKDSLISLQNNFEQQEGENESGSGKSLYYSASNYSLCSLSTSCSDSAYNNFNKFVSNFVKNQNPKERLSLLQLHSKKQISLNMMRHSLSELDTRCAEELELIERSLHHLNRLARDFNVNASSDDENEGRKLKAIEFHSMNDRDSKELKVRSNPVFIWPHEERKSRINAISNPIFFDIDKKDKSSIRK